MSHFALLWKARTIEKYRQNYENEKHNSIIMSNADIPDKTLLQRWKHYSHDVQKHLSRTFSRWYPEGTTMSNFLVNFRAEMRFPHILLRHLVGFIGGLVLTYLCFVFLVFQLSLSLIHATILSSLFGVLVTLGLTFSNRMRCLVFLLIPHLFSRAGRYTLTCYALVLILTGPATNTMKNSEVLSESMACSQEQIKTSVREINQSINKPYNSVKASIELMVEEMKRITAKLRSAMLKVNRLILSVASFIQSCFSWLGSVAQSCNNQLGTPHHRCLAVLKRSIDSSKEYPDKAPWYYGAASLARVACGVLKPFERFCVASDFAEETFYATLSRKLQTFTSRISTALFMKIRTRHSYTFVGNTSSPSQVAAGIVTEIRNRANPILTWLSWSSCVTSLFLLLIIFRAKYYQHMYDTRSRFDNRYITKEFRELDLKRFREGRETVLPLNKRERAKYVTTTSFRLVASEKVYLNRSAVFMTITSFKLLIHIVADYSLYWVLMTIHHEGMQSPIKPGLPTSGAYIAGTGFVSRLLRTLVNTLNIPLEKPPMAMSCLPNPHPPDFKRYSQIGTLISLLWIFCLFEPYGLRLRHLIMGHYKPERAKTRAAWLYNHILRTRCSFMKFARRKLHREFKYCFENKLTFRNWLRSLVPFQWLQCFLGFQLEEVRCLLCNTAEDTNDTNTELIRCKVLKCPGTYCISCYSDIGQMCTICLSPGDYGDISDVSLEKGSSDEDEDKNEDIQPNNDDAINKCSNSDEHFENYGNTSTKYESDDESEYSGNSKDINYEKCVIRRNIVITNEELYDNDYDKTVAKAENQLMKNYLAKMTLIAVNNDVLSYKQTPIVFYSFYRIHVRDMSLVVTKKGQKSRLANILDKNTTRNKKKITQKNYFVFLTCGNDKKESTQKVLNENQKNEKPGGHKNNNEKKQNHYEDIPGKNTHEDAPKKLKDNKKNTADLNNKKSKPRIESFHAKCSKYWKNISNALSCTDIDGMNKALPTIERKKHKRKKRYKKGKDKSIKHNKNRETNEDTRQYRIFSYLADQDWKKKRIDSKVKGRSSLLLQTVENEIEVNHIKIPRLNLRFSDESLNKFKENGPIMSKKDDLKEDSVIKRKEFKIGNLDRFVKRISLSSIILNTSKVPKNERKERVKTSLKMTSNSDFSMARGMKYFRSLGNNYGEETQESCDCGAINAKVKHSNTLIKPDSETSQVMNEITFNENVESVVTIKSEDDYTKTEISQVEKVRSKKSLGDLTKKWSNMKRKSSERFHGFKGPFLIIKDLYTSLFNVSDSDDNPINHDKYARKDTKKQTADKGVVVYPCTQSCGCQISLNIKNTDRCIQVDQKEKTNCNKCNRSKSMFDVQVHAIRPTCTCATQFYLNQRDVGTLKTQNSCRDQESSETESSEASDYSTDSESGSTYLSDETLTNTTVCSVSNVNYRNERTKTERENRRKRIKVKVVTKANRSTLTEKANFCDVSTVTYDWWSPIVEKKEENSKKDLKLKKKEADLAVVKEKGRRLKKNELTDERIVTFKSRAQIIPSHSFMGIEDILSPSRYLLESQKYYNELYTSKLYSPHVFPLSYTSKHYKLEPRSPVSIDHQSRRARRTKRLEECYLKKQPNPRKKRMDFSKANDSTCQVRKT